MKLAVRKFLRVTHTWLGLLAGVFVCLMGVTGGIVALRPQIASLLSPRVPPVARCLASPDWNRAEGDVNSYAQSEINRIYAPEGTDTRYHFRMAAGETGAYKHVIYDACSGRVLGAIDFGWMDWTVDLHHNLLSGRTGRRWTGAIGIVMLVSAIGGFLLWLSGRPDPGTAFRITPRFSKATPRQIHRAFGLVAAILLSVEAFTGLWLAFPQTMRGMLGAVVTPSQDARPREQGGGGAHSLAGLNQIIAAAHGALRDGEIREIRMPEGGGAVQVRMSRRGVFQAPGNDFVYLSASTARVLAVERYEDTAPYNRVIQAMTALHYDQWGRLPFRILAAAAGFATPLLFITGIQLWWYSRKRKSSLPSRAARELEPAEMVR